MTARRAFPAPIPQSGEARVYTVSQLVHELRDRVQAEFPRVVVRGEITDLRQPGSGHVYFRLKDANAQLLVVFFANRERPPGLVLEHGLAVQVEGEITVYASRGDLQLVAERVAPVGFGALQARFEALKKKLQMEGLFAEERKRPLPRYPTHIGIVTSTSGAALRDMLRILGQRASYARITVTPVRVQGAGAAEEIAAGIRLMNEWGAPDVLLVGRGGGSLEDLWAFNEEAVVRAIASSRIPVVSAVGHESDVTLSDLAADLRAATPTHAAQRAAADREEACQALDRLMRHAKERLLREIERDRRHVQGYRTHRAFRVPHRRVAEGLQSADEARERLERALRAWVLTRRREVERVDSRLRAHAPGRTLARVRDRLKALEHRAGRCVHERVARARDEVRARRRLLESFDYRGVLQRGYALVWTEDGGRLVNRAAGLRPDQPIRIQFEDARARARVTEVEAKSEEEAT